MCCLGKIASAVIDSFSVGREKRLGDCPSQLPRELKLQRRVLLIEFEQCFFPRLPLRLALPECAKPALSGAGSPLLGDFVSA